MAVVGLDILEGYKSLIPSLIIIFQITSQHSFQFYSIALPGKVLYAKNITHYKKYIKHASLDV